MNHNPLTCVLLPSSPDCSRDVDLIGSMQIGGAVLNCTVSTQQMLEPSEMFLGPLSSTRVL